MILNKFEVGEVILPFSFERSYHEKYINY